MSGTPKYPHLTVRPVDGNAFSIMGAVRQAFRKAGIPDSEFDAYMDEATIGDYDNLLAVTARWVNLKASA